MAEYIEREALSKWLHETMSAQTTVAGMGYVRKLWDKVLDTPAADVAPVVHGRWEIVQRVNIWGDMTAVHQCSNCKKSDVDGKGITRASDYCPNCGAKMDGGADRGKTL